MSRAKCGISGCNGYSVKGSSFCPSHQPGMSTTEGDGRYITPKELPKVPDHVVDDVINSTDIYKRVKEGMLNAQRKQVAYGIEKYPEPLNANTWNTLETIDHIIDESIDQLHYLIMLRIKLEKEVGLRG